MLCNRTASVAMVLRKISGKTTLFGGLWFCPKYIAPKSRQCWLQTGCNSHITSNTLSWQMARMLGKLNSQKERVHGVSVCNTCTRVQHTQHEKATSSSSYLSFPTERTRRKRTCSSRLSTNMVCSGVRCNTLQVTGEKPSMLRSCCLVQYAPLNRGQFKLHL